MRDLSAIGRLVRRAWAERPGFNAWTFARFDIWAGWRIADGKQVELAMWEDGGDVVAAAFVGESADDGVVLCLPSRADLFPELLDWIEPRRLRVEVRASNDGLVGELEARGWQRDPHGHHVPREKPLPPHDEDVRLPAGLRIAELADDEIERYNVAVQAVFGHVGGSSEAYAIVRQGPSAVHDLALVVLDAEDAVVAFAEAWLDRENGIAEFEPVGTIPRLQRHGIGSAVMREVENRLRRHGCALATVHSWSTMEGANRLYESLGYRAVDRQEVWVTP